MSDDTPRLKLAQLVSMQELNAVTWNEALAQLDALVDLCLKGQFVNTPPTSPADGDAYLVGGSPTGAWTGYAYKIASCLDGAWRFYTPFDGLRAFVTTSSTVIVYVGGTWSAIGSTDFATKSGSETLTNKSIDAAQLTGTVSVNRFNSGSGASSSTYLRGDGTWATPAGGGGGSGDVTGPASSVSGNLASFNGTTGKIIQDSGVSASALVTLSGTQALTNKTYNGNTWTAGSGTLTLGAGKTATVSNTLTFTGTDGSTVAFGAGGTIAAVAYSGSASDLSTGTLAAARLPNPSASTLGGVKSKSATSHQFLTAIGTDGSVSAAQPAAADISGLAASATTDTTSASNISSGTLADARLPGTLAGKTFSGTTGFPGSTTIDSSGKVGIGTAPSAWLDISAASLANFAVKGTGANSQATYDLWGAYDQGTPVHVQSTAVGNSGSSWYGGCLGTSSSHKMILYAANTLNYDIVIDTNGYVGVGVGSASPLAKLDVAGSIFPHADNSYNLGSASYRWGTVYAATGTINTSDQTEKQDIAALTPAETAVAKEIASLVVTYKMKSAVAAKGDGAARRHCGWLAQRVVEAFAAQGLDAFAYGCVGYDPAVKTVATATTARQPKLDAEGNPVRDAGGNSVTEDVERIVERQEPDLDGNGAQRKLYNVRPDELAAFALAGLAARLAALEAQ